MTGRDLIIYILENGLENEPVFKDGKFIGFIEIGTAAAQMNVGVPTMCTWISQKKLDGVVMNNSVYVPANFKSTLEKERSSC